MSEGWESRMAERAATRAQIRKAAADAEAAALFEPWRAFCEERGGAAVSPPHGDVLPHTHPAHGFGVYFDARSGCILGVATIAVTEEMATLPQPSECPICRDAAAWKVEQ